MSLFTRGNVFQYLRLHRFAVFMCAYINAIVTTKQSAGRDDMAAMTVKFSVSVTR